jgi:flagellar motor protein MotB
MSVWFPRVNSTDDRGAVEQVVVPRIKWHLGTRQDCKIFVVGNTDASGSDSYNKRLSERRAAAVAKSLQKVFGDMVDPEPMASGERGLFNWSVDGRRDLYNRRADILVSCG